MANDIASRDFYRSEGYLVLQGALEPTFLDELYAAVLRPLLFLEEKRLGPHAGCGTEPSLQARLHDLKQCDESAYLNALKLSQNDPTVLASANNAEIRSVLRLAGLQHPVVSLKPFPILVAENLFINNGYNLRPAHQEWPVMQGSHNGAVVWFPLHDLEDGHSSLEVFPGSHLNGVLDYEQSRCGSRITDQRLENPVNLKLNKTDLVIFSAFTAHRSTATATRMRLAMSLRYNDMADPSFIERGYPDNTRTTITREPIDELVHGFPAELQSK